MGILGHYVKWAYIEFIEADEDEDGSYYELAIKLSEDILHM
jgi:hypothetical protein